MKRFNLVFVTCLALVGIYGIAQAAMRIQTYLSGSSRVPVTTVRSLRAGTVTDTSWTDYFVLDYDAQSFTYGFSAARQIKNGLATSDTLPVVSIYAVENGDKIRLIDFTTGDSVTVPLDTLLNGKVSGLLPINHTIHDSFAVVIQFPNHRETWNAASVDCLYNIRSWVTYLR